MASARPSASISTSAVMAAVYELHRRRGQWPTSAELAAYLNADEAAVRAHLRDLQAERLYRPAQRQNRKVWMPWEAA